MTQTVSQPTHLEPSELGTKEYWDNYYQNDLELGDEDENEDLDDPSELESWFDDVDAPAKVLEYLTSEEFPLSPIFTAANKDCSVLDLGTGNGSMLFTLRLEGKYQGPMMGVDYSQQSIDLAKKLWKQYSGSSEEQVPGIDFARLDLIQDDPQTQSWWPADGYDLVLDKGTFDAISLSSETTDDGSGVEVRICELYPRKVVDMMARDGYLVVTSCNWTEKEIHEWFLHGRNMSGQLQVFGSIDYPVFEFGGQQGQGVASVCFQKV